MPTLIDAAPGSNSALWLGRILNGLAILFPQFSRYPFSVDGGFSNDPDFRFVPSFASSQVVPMTAYEGYLTENFWGSDGGSLSRLIFPAFSRQNAKLLPANRASACVMP